MSDWRAPTSWDTVCRRNAGRRRYNAARKRKMYDRLLQIIVRSQGIRHLRGVQAELARVLGVSRATICRDFRAIRNGTWARCGKLQWGNRHA